MDVGDMAAICIATFLAKVLNSSVKVAKSDSAEISTKTPTRRW